MSSHQENHLGRAECTSGNEASVLTTDHLQHFTITSPIYQYIITLLLHHLYIVIASSLDHHYIIIGSLHHLQMTVCWWGSGSAVAWCHTPSHSSHWSAGRVCQRWPSLHPPQGRGEGRRLLNPISVGPRLHPVCMCVSVSVNVWVWCEHECVYVWVRECVSVCVCVSMWICVWWWEAAYPLSDVDPGVVKSNHFEVAFARSKAELLHHTASCFNIPGWERDRKGEKES